MTSEGWTSYAPLDAEPPPCSFCRDPEKQVMVAQHGAAAICADCAERIAQVMRRHERPAAPPPPTDPRDPGSPLMVALDDRPFGDVGNPRVDARLLLAIALRDQRVAAWLRERGVDEAAIRRDFGELDLGFDA